MSDNPNIKDNRVAIFDTTLRDGQQCPGAGMTFEQNMEYARLASELQVDVLEAGFPSASSLDFNIVHTLAEELARYKYKPIIAALCQMREAQVVRTIEALTPAIKLNRARLHVYLPVDPELMPVSLGELAKDKRRLIEDLYRFIKMAVEAGCEVEFSPEGYSRMRENFDFTTELIRAAVQAGVSVINCPDTIGGATQYQGKEYFVEKMKQHAEIMKTEFPDKEIIWSVHCHNDFGLAVQNSINAVFNGPAKQIEGCINGIGERAGNAALEQCIMLIKQFGTQVNPENPFYTNIATDKLQAISDFVSKNMLVRQPHSPIAGDNAAKHSSGGHTNAILKNPLAYQPFDPKEIGKEISFLFGPMSGGNHCQSIIRSYGYICEDSEKSLIAQYIKDFYHERRKGITDEELIECYLQYRKPVKVERIDYLKSANSAKVQLYGELFGEKGLFEAEHVGPDSALTATKNLLQKKFGEIQVVHLESKSENTGIEAHSISRILIMDDNNKQYEGIGKDRDIKISAINALIDAVNKAYIGKRFSAANNQSISIQK